MIGRTLGIGMALGLSLGSLAWADDRPVAGPTDLVASISVGEDDGKDASACAQRRGRRGRRGESGEADNPYGGEEGARGQNGASAPDQSAAAGSDDPRTASAGNEGAASSGGGSQAGGEAAGGLQRSDHLDFDDRLIQGQTARAGAVYLFSRPPRDLPELVKLRRSFRNEISRTVLARDPIAPPATQPATPAPARPAARNGNGQRTSETGAQPEAGEENGDRPEGREGRGGREGREGRPVRRGGRR